MKDKTFETAYGQSIRMTEKSFSNELKRALARPDVDDMLRQVGVYYDHYTAGFPEWTDETSEDLEAISRAGSDADKTLAYVMLAAGNYDEADFLGFVACGPLEEILVRPEPELLNRVVAEARRTPRFRWMLSLPFAHALSRDAWKAIEPFVIDPDATPLPERPWA